MAAYTQSTDRKAAVNTKRFALAPLTEDTDSKITYSTVYEIKNALVSAKYTPKMNSANQYASGTEVDSYTAKAGGTLDINMSAINSADEVKMFGSKIDTATGALVSSSSDIIPANMVIYSTQRSDGKINLYKFPKVKFTSQGESAQTVDENGVTFNATALQANYKPTIYDGVDMYVIRGVDLSTAEGKALEAAWFATATGGITSSTSTSTSTTNK